MISPKTSARARFAVAVAIACVAGTAASADEMRALWADAFHLGYRNASQTTALVENARRGNFNTIIVQVRKRGDAFYDSSLEPKASEVSPQTYDPLADLIAKSHAGAEPLEVHAWIVTYNIWNRETTLPAQTDHPFRLHPDWLTQHHTTGSTWDGVNHAFDPGHPEVQQHTFDVCMDLLDNYAIDGLHLDYIRYSESGSTTNFSPWGYNPVAVQRFNRLTDNTGTPSPSDPAWLDFRRDQVTALVRKIYLNTWARRPSARVSAATITFSNPPASASAAAFSTTDAYARVLQDWRGWTEEGILDLNIAMNYRDQNLLGASFGTWCDRIQDLQFDRAGAIGLGSYLNTTPDTIGQIRIARSPSPSGNSAVGIVGFSYAVPNDDGVPRSEFLDALTSTSIHDPEPVPVFAFPEPTPSMPWKEDIALGNVMGTLIVGDDRIPADGAAIVVQGAITRTLQADATGFFGAVGLPVGEYSLTATFEDYPPITATVTVAGAGVIEFNSRFTRRAFEITSLEFDPRFGGWELRWNSSPEDVFQIQVSQDLETWIGLATGIESDGLETSYRDFTAGTDRRRFYRILK